MQKPIESTEPPFDAASLLGMARAARERAYAPYSGFPVGVALLDSSGVVHSGANVENASYGLATCAERVAITSAVASGVRSFVALAVAGAEETGPVLPCGACRQILHELAPGIAIVVAGDIGPRVVPLTDLLPEPFDSSVLPSSRKDLDG